MIDKGLDSQEILKLSLDLPDDSMYVPLTRKYGRLMLEYMKVVPQDIGDVETILTEISSNVVRHAKSQGGRFQVVLDYFADHVVITVEDQGKGFSIHHVAEVGSARPDPDCGERIGGLGLPLLALLADRVEFSRTIPQGTIVCAEKRLHYANNHDLESADKMNGENASIYVRG